MSVPGGGCPVTGAPFDVGVPPVLPTRTILAKSVPVGEVGSARVREGSQAGLVYGSLEGRANGE